MFDPIASFFGYDDMIGNYEQRKVANHKDDNVTVDTVRITDSDHNFETAVLSDEYKSGKWIVLEEYDTIEQAKVGHDKWVKIMTTEPLPETITDVSTSNVVNALREAGGQTEFKRKKRRGKK